MPRKRGKWEYKGHFIDNNVPGSASYYVYWYEYDRPHRKRKVCRKSLKTESFEEAQDELIKFVLTKDTSDDNALVLAVLQKYTEEVTSNLPSADAADRACVLFAEVLDGSERILDLSESFQREAILKVWRNRFGHSVGYMSRNMTVLSAAIEHSRIKDAPKVYYNKNWIAEKMRMPAPVAGKWIPKDDQLAQFIDELSSEKAFHWLMIALNTACRPEAALDLGPSQIDLDARLVRLNPEGRPQDPRKFRPDIRLTENLERWTETMPLALQDVKSDEDREQLLETKPWKLQLRYVPYRTIDSLQSTFNRTRKKLEMPALVPYSIRHKMTTVLRSKQVPEDQVAVLLGHRRPEFRTTRMYGEYDPGYLRDAANAIDEYLFELDKRTDRDLFPKSRCKSVAKDNVIRLSQKARKGKRL